MKRYPVSVIKRVIRKLLENEEKKWEAGLLEIDSIDALTQGEYAGAIAAYKTCLALLEGTSLDDVQFYPKSIINRQEE